MPTCMMAKPDPGRGVAWSRGMLSLRDAFGLDLSVATMGTGLACACPRLSLRSHARCVVWSACLSLWHAVGW